MARHPMPTNIGAHLKVKVVVDFFNKLQYKLYNQNLKAQMPASLIYIIDKYHK